MTSHDYETITQRSSLRQVGWWVFVSIILVLFLSSCGHQGRPTVLIEDRLGTKSLNQTSPKELWEAIERGKSI